jgi:cytochrome P450
LYNDVLVIDGDPGAGHEGTEMRTEAERTEAEVYYDPYDFEIDSDPYPIWKRLRDERPLYYNERYGFYALSRFEDVERCLVDWKTYSSAHGTS